MSTQTPTPWLREFNRKCDDLAIEQANLLVSMRQRRADILGLSIDEMLKQDNRNALIARMQAEHKCSWEDAEAYVDGMEEVAAQERERERLEALRGMVDDENFESRKDL